MRIVSPKGEILGTIPTSLGMQSVGFAGKVKKTMFAVARGAAYRISMLPEGIRSRAK
jgi:gluconolactonase